MRAITFALLGAAACFTNAHPACGEEFPAPAGSIDLVRTGTSLGARVRAAPLCEVARAIGRVTGARVDCAGEANRLRVSTEFTDEPIPDAASLLLRGANVALRVDSSGELRALSVLSPQNGPGDGVPGGNAVPADVSRPADPPQVPGPETVATAHPGASAPKTLRLGRARLPLARGHSAASRDKVGPEGGRVPPPQMRVTTVSSPEELNAAILDVAQRRSGGDPVLAERAAAGLRSAFDRARGGTYE